MNRLLPIFSISLLTVLVGGQLRDSTEQSSSIYYTEPALVNTNNTNSRNNYDGFTELHGVRIVRGQKVLERVKNPYLIREDLIVEKDGELLIEGGVEIRFGPMVGITVRGIITAKVCIYIYMYIRVSHKFLSLFRCEMDTR